MIATGYPGPENPGISEADVEALIAGDLVGVLKDRGAFSAAGGAYPATGGSGAAGAIMAGDIWTISVAGTLPTGQIVEVGDVIRSLVDTPGNTQANWTITQANLVYLTATFTPTVTLVGGVGNTVPVYSTNSGRYTRMGNRVIADILLSGDGGAEGAGSGNFTIALPVAAHASFLSNNFLIGTSQNGAAGWPVCGNIAGGASVITLTRITNVAVPPLAFTGAEQNNATRYIRLQINYEI